MMAPLRFLGVAIGGWVCVRAAMLAPDWPQAEPPGRAEPQRQAVGKAWPVLSHPVRPVLLISR